MKNLFRLFVLTAVLFTAVWSASAQNEVKINIQGTLKDANSAAVSDGNYAAVFRLYPSSSGGMALWEESAEVRVVGGVYTHRLGSVTPLNSADFDSTLYVGVTINDIELLPRLELTYAPYTLHTPYATFAGNGVLPGTMVFFGGPVANIPEGYLPCDGQAYNSADYPTLFAAIGAAWGDGSENNFGSGSADFNVPSTGGQFLRGWGGGSSSADPDRSARTAILEGGATGNSVGSLQGDAMKEHTHTYSGSTNTDGSHSHGTVTDLHPVVDGTSPEWYGNGSPSTAVSAYSTYRTVSGSGSGHSHTYSGTTANSGTGVETRPKNVSVLFIIKT